MTSIRGCEPRLGAGDLDFQLLLPFLQEVHHNLDHRSGMLKRADGGSPCKSAYQQETANYRSELQRTLGLIVNGEHNFIASGIFQGLQVLQSA